MITPQFEKEWMEFSTLVGGTVGFEEGGRIKVESIYKISTNGTFVNFIWSNLPEPGKGVNTIAKTEFWFFLQNATLELKVFPKDTFVQVATLFKRKCHMKNDALNRDYMFLSNECRLIERLSNTSFDFLNDLLKKDIHLQTQKVGDSNFIVLTVNKLLVNAKELSVVYKCVHSLTARIDEFS
jgi:hypothetical protein